MSDYDKSVEQLINELQELRLYVSKLEANQLSRQDKLKLAIIDRSPFTMWAADCNFRIALWEGQSEQVYGLRKRDAIGANYLDLFVDEVEREQSRVDCLRVIKEDTVFSNFLAYDHTRDGRKRTMLTSCFRIWDEESNQNLQAEVAIEISDLDLRVAEHRTLREAGIAHKEQQKRLFALEQRELLGKVMHTFLTKSNIVEDRIRNIDQYRIRVKKQMGAKSADSVTSEEIKKLEAHKLKIKTDHDILYYRISSASSIEDLESIKNDVTLFESYAIS